MPRRAAASLASLMLLLTPATLVAQAQRFTAETALDVVTYTIRDLSDDGVWLAATSGTRRDRLGIDHRRDGDPSYVAPALQRLWAINTGTGAAREVFPEKRDVRAAAWSPDGRRLAVLVLQGEAFALAVWDRESAKLTWPRLPPDRYVAENSELSWSRGGDRVLLALRSRAWKDRVARRFGEMTAGPIVVQSSKDPFLAWDALRREGSVRAVAAFDLKSGRVDEVLPESKVTTWMLAEDDSTLVWQEDITPKTDYDVLFGTETKLMSQRGLPASRLTVLPSTKGLSLVWSRDGFRFAYAKDGGLYVGTARDTTRRLLAGLDSAAAARASADTSKAARDARDKERFTPVRWSADARELIASNSEGLWVLDAATGVREMFLETRDTLTGPRYTVVGWSEDGRGILLRFASRTRWERGLARYDRPTRRLVDLARDGRIYETVRLARSGAGAVLAIADGNRPADLYAADGELAGSRRLVETNPALAGVAFGKTELIDYLDGDGKRQYGVVYYPTDYQAGRRYPTVFYVYESFFDDRFEAIANVLTGQGYLVVQPSVSFETGYPGEAWLKGVTAAANHLIDRGVADSTKLGLQGISYGGYATNLLVTQTRRFKAAINISGKVDLISFYTDSPRLGVRNVHAAEKSQDRIGATLWQQPQKYVQHSAVMFADRIATPLLLLTGELDSNVPAGNTREMFYALRRLGKEVTWVNYLNGGHGTPMSSAADFLDFHQRMVEWYDTHLKGAQAKATTTTGSGH
jgi:dipeptidyl aminopeptidase/acylaminoacyl peptidase